MAINFLSPIQFENSLFYSYFFSPFCVQIIDYGPIQIIGNTPYRYIPQKTYRKYDTDIAAKIADKLGESGIKFSGKITAETTTITVSKADIERLEEIAHSFTAEKEKFAIGELKLQSNIDYITILENEAEDFIQANPDKIVYSMDWNDKPKAIVKTVQEVRELGNIFAVSQNDWNTYLTDRYSAIDYSDRNNLPTITVEWSEHNNIEDGKTYSITEFDNLMNKLDSEWLKLCEEEINTYGSAEAAMNADDAFHLGYAKTKFTVNMPNGDKFTERLDIGDGDGDLIAFLNKYPKYEIVADVLKKTEEAENTMQAEKSNISNTYDIIEVAVENKDKFAIGESHKQSHEVQLSRAEFIEYATDKLINDITVRNAHENSDLENFNNEINKSISELFTELIVGKEQIENYTINEIAPLYDEFQSDEAFRIDICNIISENVDISLTQLEITRDKAQELGVNEIVELPKKENPMDRAIRLINEYCEKEFGSPGNFSNMDHIELAYKPDEETGLAGIEAYADLETFRIVKEQDGRVVDEQLFNSLDHMNTVLKNLDFDKLIELSDNDKSEIKATAFENTEKKSPDVSELSVGDVILYDGKRREVEQISENSISLKDLDAPDFGGILLGTSDVLAYNGWQQDMNEKGFEILSKAAPQITSKDHQSQLSLFGEPVVYESDVEEKAIYAALMRGSGFQDGKFRIEEFCKENHSINEFAKMLKDEYGTGGRSGNEFYAFENYDSKGIEIILNRKYDNEEGKKIHLKWKEVAERISELVSKGEYITKADIDDRIYHAKYTLKHYNSNSESDKIHTERAKNILKEYGILSENTESNKVIPESEITFTKPDNNSDLKNNIEESDAKNPEENNKPDIPQKITVGDRFRHKITGNISEVVSLTGAFPWITDECTVTRDSGAFSVTENISYNQLLNSDLYEYIDHTDRTVEQAKKSMKSDMKIENFKITGDFIIEGGAKSKFKANSEAIRTLKMIEKENRPATPEEQVILSRYVGWGGLSAAFDSKNEQWSVEYSELKNLLTDEEYNAARASVLDSFYTPPFIIESIYSALENMGFHGGSVLDPSTGTGNFLGKMPGSMSDNSRIYAVEKDSVSGRIAKFLYPDADIQITGFEKRDFSDNFFDVAVGNIPFGGFKISDRRYDKYNFEVHDYFIAKTLDKVRPGGVIAFITSSGTLDKANPSVRKYISQRAELLGAVRLPNNAFKSYAGTEVTSDIIFLRKREKMIDIAPDWVYTSKNPDGLTINNYFIENPEMILGKVVEGNKLYGKGTMVVPFENSDLKVILNEAVKKIKGNYTAEKSVIAKPSGKKKDKFKPEILPADPTVKNFSYAEIDGKIFYRENSIMTEIPFTGKRYERVSGIAAISKCVRELLNMQLEGYSDEAIISKRTELNQLYDDFTKKNGLLNDKTNRDIFREDVSLPLVLSLEKVKDGKLIGKADIFTKRTLQPPVRITHADTAADALAVSISEKAGVDLDFMSELMDGKEKSEIISDLKGVIFLNPETSAWETADAYLSGNIRNKLAVAKSAAESNPDFTENVSALEAAMPDRIEAGDITAKLGSPWIDDKYIGIQHNPATHLQTVRSYDFLTLYPNANILIAHEDDFKKENRQKLCAKIATGEFDAIIIGHSQLIKIPVSKEREEQFIQDQINELINDIAEMKEQNAESFTVKDMERTKRDYEAKLKKLIEKPIKDDVVTFEEMGVDKLFIDEADMFKNLSVSTKMRNISGVAANRKVQKTQDLYIKCQYLDELTGGKGIVFATGTPVSNSITELFIMQKYLQADYLRESGLTHFDAWAANFAQKVTKLEYAPTGKGFRQKTRLSKFSNLPELMTAFKECADIKTAQDLNLPEPECERHIIAAEPTETQKNLIQSLSERAEKIHNKQVTPDVDNMLKVTTDGIKIGLDQRLINPLLPDEPNTKINMCVNNVTDIWKQTADERLTQVIFCDYSTPKKDAFNLYDDVKSKLIANGIPENEIAFIHDYEKPQDKERLFDKVRNGEIRIVLGSTQKMGAGTNIQNKLYAMHHLDAPWKPRDMEQRLGRMKRQGNMNDKVHEYIYVTKDTFDAYRFQTLETKQGFISQIMTIKNPVRVCEDVSQSEMEFAEVKALCAGNPLIREKMEIDIEVHKLQTLKSAYLNQRYKLEDNVLKHIPESIAKAKENLNAVLADSKITVQNPLKRDGEGNVIFPGMTINDHVYADKKEAGTALIEAAAKALTGNPNARTEIGQYRGFRLDVFFDSLSNDIKMDIKGNGSYRITLSSSDTGNLTRIDNAINHIPEKIDEYKSEIEALNTQLENSKAELAKPFLKEQELKTKLTRQSELDRQLNLDNKENLLGKDNVKSFELETEADRQKLNSHNSTQKKNSQSYDLEL